MSRGTGIGQDADGRERTGEGVPARAALALLVALTVWSVGYELSDTLWRSLASALPWSGVAPDVAAGLGGAVVMLRGLRHERAWFLIGLGAVCWAAGDTYWTLNLSQLASPPVPSWADAGYLSLCPLWFLGLCGLMHSRVRRAPPMLMADAAAAALAVGAMSAALVLDPVLSHASGSTLSIATNLAYPLVDMLLLGLIVGATALRGWRLERAWTLLGIAVLMFWVADSFYLVADATGSYQLSSWYNPLWYAAPAVVGWAAWLPRRSRVEGAERARPAENGARRGIVMPLGFACLALALLVYSSFSSLGAIAVVLATASLLVNMGRMALTWREHGVLLRTSRSEALTDSLTGLGNRRALTLELERRLTHGHSPFVLALFDLDGFKHYNDTFGHPAGDALLARLGARLSRRIGAAGQAFRMGGDEFCALIDISDDDPAAVTEAAAAALSEHGEGFAIGCSFGSILIPHDAVDAETALRTADQRMYAHKHGARDSAARQSRDVLLRVLAERNPELDGNMRRVADLAAATAQDLGLAEDEVQRIRQAAELHDVGKVAIPDDILTKPGPLDPSEWTFIHRHPLVGERIVAAAPALRPVGRMIRSSHERFDGSGYPDALAGEEIPLGARIIAVCDAYQAMTSERPYRRARDQAGAIRELRRCAGSQFDPAVVESFCRTLLEAPAAAARAA